MCALRCLNKKLPRPILLNERVWSKRLQRRTKVVDRLVYGFYDLTEEEIKIVEGAVAQ